MHALPSPLLVPVIVFTVLLCYTGISSLPSCTPAQEMHPYSINLTEYENLHTYFLWNQRIQTYIRIRLDQNKLFCENRTRYTVLYCFDRKLKFMKKTDRDRRDGVILDLDSKLLTFPNDTVTQWIEGPLRVEPIDTLCNYLPVYAKPSDVSCDIIQSEKEVIVNCTTDKVYPEAACKFYTTTDNAPEQLLTEDVTYTHTERQEEVTSTLGTHNSTYYKTTCTTSFPISSLGSGSHSLRVNMYPNLTEEGDQYGVEWTLKSPIVIVTLALESSEDQGIVYKAPVGGHALIEIRLLNTIDPNSYSLSSEINGSSYRVNDSLYAVHYTRESPMRSCVGLMMKNLKTSDFGAYTLTISDVRGDNLNYSFVLVEVKDLDGPNVPHHVAVAVIVTVVITVSIVVIVLLICRHRRLAGAKRQVSESDYNGLQGFQYQHLNTEKH